MFVSFYRHCGSKLERGRLLLLFNVAFSDSAEFLSCVESAFLFCSVELIGELVM